MKTEEVFTFRKNDRIGYPDAEDDAEFLADCFVDTGDLATLRNVGEPQRVLVGRTGTGKTALTMQLRRQEENVIEINPENLSFQYLSNSTILPTLEDWGVNLDLFYRLLWRHIFSVELIKRRYKIVNQDAKSRFLDTILPPFLRSRQRNDAVKYLMSWGDTFWQTVDVRVQEVSKHFEQELEAGIGAVVGDGGVRVGAGIGGSKNISEDQKMAITNRAREIVSGVQMQSLSEIINLLAEIFADPQPRFFITIDRLDEHWVVDKFRYKLIRALIETVRDFRRVPSVKIVVALRKDLIDHVFRVTRDAGFQEEKYEGMYLPCRWSSEFLLELLDRRVNELIRRRYTKQPISWKDILPKEVDDKSIDKFIIERTHYRPRDVIAFFNECIQHAEHSTKVSVNRLRTAEGAYSRSRFRALADEWQREYPTLLSVAKAALSRRRPRFVVKDIDMDKVAESLLEDYDLLDGNNDELSKSLCAVLDGSVESSAVRPTLVKVFYTVGLIGITLEPKGAIQWAFRQRETISESEVEDESRVQVCPMFYRVLGIEEPR